MSTTQANLSRRNLIGRFATAAIAVAATTALAPTVASIDPPPVASLPPTPTTQIATLWDQYRRLRRRHGKLSRKLEELEPQVAALMPRPDPSITHSPENNKIGLRFWRRGEPPDTMHGCITPHIISQEIDSLSRCNHRIMNSNQIPPGAYQLISIRHTDESKGVEHVAFFNESQPLEQKQVERIEDFKKRVKLSEAYERKIAQTERSSGYARVRDERWQILNKMEILRTDNAKASGNRRRSTHQGVHLRATTGRL